MLTGKTEQFIKSIAKQAGITIGGSQPWDMQIHSPQFYRQIIRKGSLGLGESYMRTEWDCQQLDEFFFRVLSAKLDEQYKNMNLSFIRGLNQGLRLLHSTVRNLQNKSRSLKVGEHHYDTGNHLYQYMLDKGMNYSCAYWRHASSLEEAQEAKLKLICDKLYLKPGMTVLDIGCGFGSFAKYAASHYGVNIVAITISKEQLAWAKKECADLPVELRFQDYRDVDERFDRIASIGMLEHVGYKNYPTYMRCLHRCLKPQGLCLIQTIGNNQTMYTSDPWIGKHIFPNSLIPSIAQLANASEPYLHMEDWHNFGPDYDKTLMCWHKNFNQHWQDLAPYHDERFRRMWNYYLLSCAGAFRSRTLQLWQIVFSHRQNHAPYLSIR